MDSVLEELKNAARESIDNEVARLGQLLEESWEKKEDNEARIREALIAILSRARTPYEATVAQVREPESVGEVSELWERANRFYTEKLRLWEGLRRLWRSGPENGLFVGIGNLLKKLEDASAQHNEFHAVGDGREASQRAKTKLTAVFESCEEGGYHAFIAEIRGIHSQGETLKEASENLADALGLFVLDELEDKLSGVSPTTDRIEIELSFSQSETTRA